MPPNLALFFAFLFVFFVFLIDRKHDGPISPTLFCPLLWFLVTSTRPLGVWLHIWGVPFGVPSLGLTEPTEGGNIDRWFYSILGLIGIYILSRRRLDWRSICRENSWLIVLFVFMGLSIFWSDYPYVSLKRFMKTFFSLVMVLVILTEQKPLVAMTTILRRCALIYIPFSIVTIRFFRHIGLFWDWTGTAVSWVGTATSKNTLGQAAAISTIIFIWCKINKQKSTVGKLIDYVYIIMSLYLLKGSDDAVSMTSLSVFAVGLFVFLWVQHLKDRTPKIRNFASLSCGLIFLLLLTLVVHTLNPFSANSLLGTAVTAMGRDMTLTGRTEIWMDVFKTASMSSLFGVGYGGFWIGEKANISWSADRTWTLGQAHNGYIDVYLQLGWIGIVLLFIIIVSTVPKIVRSFEFDFEYARLRMTFFLLILFVNITESTFLRGGHALWFLFLMVIVSLPHVKERNFGFASETYKRFSNK